MFSLMHNALIPMLHRIGQRDTQRIPANQNMVIEPDELADFVHDARNRGWGFISLDELVDLVNEKKSSKKVIALTFDDGYLDNYKQAFPILMNLNVPFSVYVTTGFIEGDLFPWWYQLEYVVNRGPELLDPLGKRYKTETLEDMNLAFLSIRKDLMSSNKQFCRYTDWLDQSKTETHPEHPTRLFMTWQELQTLAESKLVTIGAHTHTHPVLSTLGDEAAYTEIEKSKWILSERLKREVSHFAFPFGGAGEISDRDVRYSREIGFKSAVTTTHGAVRTGGNVDLFALPRLFIGPGFHLQSIQLRLLKSDIKQAARSFIRSVR